MKHSIPFRMRDLIHSMAVSFIIFGSGYLVATWLGLR